MNIKSEFKTKIKFKIKSRVEPEVKSEIDLIRSNLLSNEITLIKENITKIKTLFQDNGKSLSNTSNKTTVNIKHSQLYIH